MQPKVPLLFPFSTHTKVETQGEPQKSHPVWNSIQLVVGNWATEESAAILFATVVVAANGNAIAVNGRFHETRAGKSFGLSWRAAEWV